ncbi:MAG: aspartate-semialdehyde dehydrogenase [Clostridiales bacterium]|nr:aspartate-semialdehyde dehydrogenase [Clostridiales bacterium]
MKKYNIGIIGATGAVGEEMISILDERNFPISELRCLASERSEGKILSTPFGDITVQKTSENVFDGLDIVLGASDEEIAIEMAPHIIKAGAVFIDNSSAFRMDDGVPLVVPEVNPEDAHNHKGVISNPNCSTTITLVAINAINNLSKIEKIYASTYQATSGAGNAGPQEMYEQSATIIKSISDGGGGINHGTEIQPKVFQHQIAFNLIPQIGGFDEKGYTSEEMKLQNEGRKIMHLPDLKVSCTCVRVPVERSHAISANIITEKKLSLDEVREAIASAPGCKLYDDSNSNKYPMPVITSNQDIVYVGRLREDLADEKGINLWCCGDQVRKGAATNAIQIAELLI